jgi:hypothetical protein
MIHIKKIGLFLLMTTLISCTEIYVPNVNSDTTALVVEGLITDEDGPFTVQLAQAMPYASGSTTTKYVTDAKLTISDNEGQTYGLTYRDSGNYITPSTFKTKVGNSYVLHIATSDGNTYESKTQTLLPPESYDSIYTKSGTKDYLDQDNNVKTRVGFEIRANLFSTVTSSNPTPLCRFKSNIVVQYEYTYKLDKDPATDTIPKWFYMAFAWNTYPLDDNNNITEERTKTANPMIKDHLVSFVPLGAYSLPDGSTSLIYYYRFNQYTINEDTYNFYKEANSQLAASGKLFDPITSQISGNMKCTSDPSKIVLGLFEVSSVTQAAFVLSNSSNITSMRKVPYIDIPTQATYKYKVATELDPTSINNPEYDVIPYPSWWYHK